jgi:hypothetical protein
MHLGCPQSHLTEPKKKSKKNPRPPNLRSLVPSQLSLSIRPHVFLHFPNSIHVKPQSTADQVILTSTIWPVMTLCPSSRSAYTQAAPSSTSGITTTLPSWLLSTDLLLAVNPLEPSFGQLSHQRLCARTLSNLPSPANINERKVC